MTIQFTSHAVAFVDILGFTSLINKAEAADSEEAVAMLSKLFKEVIPKSTVFDGFSSYVPVHCLSVSDSIVIASSHHDKDGNFDAYSSVVAVSIKCIQIAHALLDLGLLVKGAITVGPAYMIHELPQNGRMSNILGSGYMRAYHLEQDTKAPLIRLDKTASDALLGGGIRLAIFANSREGMIVDSIFAGSQFFPDPSEQISERFERYAKIISNKLSEHDSWAKFADFFNAHVRRHSELREVEEIHQSIDLAYELNCLNPTEETTHWMDNYSIGAKFLGPIVHD